MPILKLTISQASHLADWIKARLDKDDFSYSDYLDKRDSTSHETAEEIMNQLKAQHVAID